ncbi:MAG: bifunctional tetrahydrofolate synthase/dihydrofolate synthase [Colwellia sp.]
MNPFNASHSGDHKDLIQWLYYLETIHNVEIDLGLARINVVAKQLSIDLSFATVITVAGTNGKGTTCAFLENALLDEQKSVAVYSSPHIERFNERLRVNKLDVDDNCFIEAFERIERVRADISLSYYEFTTLAALLILMKQQPDVIILEVGLGGRLDATNIIDADVAVITTIDLDHQAFLGDNRESIGFEKAGVMRANQHIVIGDPNPPKSVLAHALSVNNILLDSCASLEQHTSLNSSIAINPHINVHGVDFFVKQTLSNENAACWQWQYKSTESSNDIVLIDLQPAHIPQNNVATALMVLCQLGVLLSSEKVNILLNKTRLAGRAELFKKNQLNQQKSCDVLLDVAHNPQAARYLADKLQQYRQQNKYQNIYAVASMLGDKDITATFIELKDEIDHWYLGQLAMPRAASTDHMKEKLNEYTNSINCFDNVTQAFKMVNQDATLSDLIVVFGSFHTVAEIRRLLV